MRRLPDDESERITVVILCATFDWHVRAALSPDRLRFRRPRRLGLRPVQRFQRWSPTGLQLFGSVLQFLILGFNRFGETAP